MQYSAGLLVPCRDEMDLFYSPVEDGRTEPGREEREALAGIVCSGCSYRLKCLEQALVDQEDYGVWGGMGEGERRKFKSHLREEGYDKNEIPEGLELVAALNSFYRLQYTPDERYHGVLSADEEIAAHATDYGLALPDGGAAVAVA